MHSFDKTKLSDIQREYFESMPEGQKDLIRKGAPLLLFHLKQAKQFVHLIQIIMNRLKMLMKDLQEYCFRILWNTIKIKKADVVEQ